MMNNMIQILFYPFSKKSMKIVSWASQTTAPMTFLADLAVLPSLEQIPQPQVTVLVILCIWWIQVSFTVIKRHKNPSELLLNDCIVEAISSFANICTKRYVPGYLWCPIPHVQSCVPPTFLMFFATIISIGQLATTY